LAVRSESDDTAELVGLWKREKLAARGHLVHDNRRLGETPLRAALPARPCVSLRRPGVSAGKVIAWAYQDPGIGRKSPQVGLIGGWPADQHPAGLQVPDVNQRKRMPGTDRGRRPSVRGEAQHEELGAKLPESLRLPIEQAASQFLPGREVMYADGAIRSTRHNGAAVGPDHHPVDVPAVRDHDLSLLASLGVPDTDRFAAAGDDGTAVRRKS
jgi:hypothetical protein